MCILTSARQENLYRHILEEIASREYRANLRKVPFPVQVIAVLEHLKSELEKNTWITFFHEKKI